MVRDEAKLLTARALWRAAEGQRREAMRLCAEALGGGERGGRFFDAEGEELDEADLEDWLDQ